MSNAQISFRDDDQTLLIQNRDDGGKSFGSTEEKEISAIPKTQQESSELALEITSNAGCCHNLKP